MSDDLEDRLALLRERVARRHMERFLDIPPARASVRIARRRVRPAAPSVTRPRVPPETKANIRDALRSHQGTVAEIAVRFHVARETVRKLKADLASA